MVFIGLLEVILAICCVLMFDYLKSDKTLPNNWPVVGMLPYVLLHIHHLHEWCTTLLANSQNTFLYKGMWLTGMQLLVTADPENINYMLTRNFSNFPKGDQFREIFEILGDGIFNSDFESWKTQRRMAQMMVSDNRFKNFVVRSTQTKVESCLIPVIENIMNHDLVVDLQDLFQRFTFDATCMIVSGHDPKCLAVELPEVAFAMAIDDAEEAIFRRHIVPIGVWKLQKLLNIGHERKLKAAWKTIDLIVDEIIGDMKRDHRPGKGDHILASFVRDYDCDDKFLRDMILSFLLAGRDTTSSALVWFFWLLSSHKEAEEAIRRELMSEGAKEWKLFSMEDVKGLPYLHGALCETLRLYPPVPFEHKAPLQEDMLPSGHKVKPRNKILISVYSMGRMASIWGDDCREFKPERWILEKGRIKHEPSYKFLAFNAGPRSCLGKEVAFTQMKMVAAAIIHNYELHVIKGQDISPRWSVILQMQNGLKVKFSRRWSSTTST